MTTIASSKLRHAPPEWRPGATRVRYLAADEDQGRLGTFVRNSQPLPGVTPAGWLGVLIRFDGDRNLVDVDPAGLEVVCLHDPFAAVRPTLPTRYAPGAAGVPYDYPNLYDWHPVIYYPAGTVIESEGPIWLVEPYPAERADGTDGCDPVTSAGVAVLSRAAAPRPRGITYHAYRGMTLAERRDCDGDWIIPGSAPERLTAYDAYVTNQADLLAAWVEAYAIAATLNTTSGTCTSLHAEDVEVLLAAERHALIIRRGVAGAIYQSIGAEPDEWRSVPEPQLDRLCGGVGALLEVGKATYTGSVPTAEQRLAGAAMPQWQAANYFLTAAGRDTVKMIRERGFEFAGPRCRECGCTDNRACKGGCRWVTAGPRGPLCSACPDRPRR